MWRIHLIVLEMVIYGAYQPNVAVECLFFIFFLHVAIEMKNCKAEKIEGLSPMYLKVYERKSHALSFEDGGIF